MAHQQLLNRRFTRQKSRQLSYSEYQRSGLTRVHAEPIQFSHIALPELLAADRSFELIYVDGSHIFEEVSIDPYYPARLLEDGGIVAFDDCTDAHVRKLIRFIDRNWSEFFRRVRIDDLVPKSWKRELARGLGRQQLVAYEKIQAPPREWNATYVDF